MATSVKGRRDETAIAMKRVEGKEEEGDLFVPFLEVPVDLSSLSSLGE